MANLDGCMSADALKEAFSIESRLVFTDGFEIRHSIGDIRPMRSLSSRLAGCGASTPSPVFGPTGSIRRDHNGWAGWRCLGRLKSARHYHVTGHSQVDRMIAIPGVVGGIVDDDPPIMEANTRCHKKKSVSGRQTKGQRHGSPGEQQ